MSLTPQSLYQQELRDGAILSDSAQELAVGKLEQLFQMLQQHAGFWGTAFGRRKPVQGLYLWGSVGVGKTFLMDLFYSCLPETRKLRLHYHHFMARIHDEMRCESGTANPLDAIARRMARDVRVLCLDELYITDIGDGMIVYNLFKTLFAEGVVMIITSNFPVDKLYKDELQPQLFEPAIALIKANTRYLRLDGGRDYRLLQDNPRQTYFSTEEKDFAELFAELNPNDNSITEELLVCGRPLAAIRHNRDSAWFTFDTLCNGPRSKLDYIELGERFNTLLISDVPELGSKSEASLVVGTEDISPDNHAEGTSRRVFGPKDNAARRFMTLVDELYDRGVNLYLSARVPLENLYVGEALAFEFQRTRSRLIEMQSEKYLQSTPSQLSP